MTQNRDQYRLKHIYNAFIVVFMLKSLRDLNQRENY